MAERKYMKDLKVHISGIEKLSKGAYGALDAVASIEYVRISNTSELINSLSSCDVFWFRLNHKLTKEILEQSTCKYILCAVTGLDHIDLKACKEQHIQVISLKGESEFLKEVRATSEHAFGLLLSLIRGSKEAFRHVETDHWNRNLFQGTELFKKKMGILGLGRLGSIMADYAVAFGMEVYYYDIVDKSSKHKRCHSMEELFRSVDMMSIHISYDDSTHHIINDEVLSKIEKPLFIVNTSRGGIINEKDLLAHVESGRVKGYAADVLHGEPDIEQNALVQYARQHNNVILTPHIGGYTWESIEKTENFIAQKFIEKLYNERR